jgi:hypothetical protein
MTNYLNRVISKTNDDLLFAGLVSGFENRPSINNLGNVAYIARVGATSNEFLTIGNEEGNTVINANSGRTFSTSLQINDRNRVIARGHCPLIGIGFQILCK